VWRGRLVLADRGRDGVAAAFLVDLPADVSGKAPVRQRRVGEAVELPAEPLAVERLRLVER